MSMTSDLIASIKKGSAAAQKLLRDCPAAAYGADSHGRSPLAWACLVGNEAASRALITGEGWLDEVLREVCAQTALQECIAFSILLDFLRPDARTPDHLGFAPIHYACASDDRLGTLKLLLNHRANLDAPTKDGDYPLHIAARRGSLQIVMYLMQEYPRMIDPRKRNKYGILPGCFRDADVLAAQFLPISRLLESARRELMLIT